MNAQTLHEHLLNGAVLKATARWRRNKYVWEHYLKFPDRSTLPVQESNVDALLRKKIIRVHFEMTRLWKDYELVAV